MTSQLSDALARHQQGDVVNAERMYQSILGAAPASAEALHLLGLLYLQTGRVDGALDLIGRSLRIEPGQPIALLNLAAALRSLHRPADALIQIDQALRQLPEEPAAWNVRGEVLLELNRPAEALQSFDAALGSGPGVPEWHNNRGNALHALGRTAEAIACYERALWLRPGFARALNNRATALKYLGSAAEALEGYEQALRCEPDYTAALQNRGNLLLELGRLDQALASFDRILQLDPANADAHAARGIVCIRLRRVDAALTSLQRAVALRPEVPRHHINLGNALLELHQPREALQHIERGLKLAPEDADALNNLGAALRALGDHGGAAEAFERLLRIAPHYDYAIGSALQSRLDCCDWQEYAQRVGRVCDAVQAGRRAVAPLTLLAVSDSASLQLQCARTLIADKYPPVPSPEPIPARRSHQRIRIAYLSANFGEHPVSYLLAGVLEQHQRARFEVHGFSFRPPGSSAVGRRIAAAFEHLIDVSDRSDLLVAALMRELEIDVAVDLMGLTLELRTGIFAARAAPVQVSYLGYPGTTGARYIDYLIADAQVIEPGDAQQYEEQIVRLPDCFLPNDDRREVDAAGASRAALGLPESAFVFCAFTSPHKLNPAVFDSWMRCLIATPDSVLWLRSGHASARENLRREAEVRGVDPLRLVMAPYVADPSLHLARYQGADLFLDTWPYNSHSTACDALWAGLPVLTMRGESFASRVAASALRAVGLPELVTTTPREYEALAVRLAAQHEELARVRATLQHHRRTQPLFDTRRTCRQLETAYERMWEQSLQAAPPAAFNVEP